MFFNDAVTALSRSKNIRIKVDAQIEKLIGKSNETIQFIMEALNRFEKESSSFCGKAYEYEMVYLATSQLLKKGSLNSLSLDFYGIILASLIQWRMTQLNSSICQLTMILQILGIFKARSSRYGHNLKK